METYSLPLKGIRVETDKFARGKEIGITHNGNHWNFIGPFTKEELKLLRKVIRKTIREYESTERFQVKAL